MNNNTQDPQQIRPMDPVERGKGETRLETFSKLIGILGAIIAAFGAIVAAFIAVYQLDRSISQSQTEFIWKQAEYARGMVDRMHEDEGWQAMKMLDWEEGQEFEMPTGEKISVTPADAIDALKVAIYPPSTQRTKKQIAISNRFDRLFFMVSQLQIAIRSGLVNAADVQFPLSWYAEKKMCPHKALFRDYMAANSAKETSEFFDSLVSWKNCSAS